MKQSCGGILPLVVILFGLSACQGGLPPTSRHTTNPIPTASTPTPDPQRCERLARRGFTPCPPTPDKLPLPPTTIRNATNGAISDVTAREWGRAFQLTEAYYRWAMQANARGVLTSGAIADPSPQAVDNLFGPDLMDLDDAKRAGGTLLYEPPAITVAQVVVVATSLQDAMRRQGLTPAGYGLAVRFTGPTIRSIRAADGGETVVATRDATYSVDGILWGEVKSDADLGTIWYEHGAYGCAGSVRDVCQL